MEERNFWYLVNGAHRESEKQPKPEKQAPKLRSRNIVICRIIKLNIAIS